MSTKQKGFTLIEILVVVLIIGILAAIALPKYNAAVMKTELHKGIPLVESIYLAQKAYMLANGGYATSFDDLDVSLPLNESCTKTTHAKYVRYSCDFGLIGLMDTFTNISFQTADKQIAYVHFIKDLEVSLINTTLEKDKKYCFAKNDNPIANNVCKSMSGNLIAEYSGGWNYYQLD